MTVLGPILSNGGLAILTLALVWLMEIVELWTFRKSDSVHT